MNTKELTWKQYASSVSIGIGFFIFFIPANHKVWEVGWISGFLMGAGMSALNFDCRVKK